MNILCLESSGFRNLSPFSMEPGNGMNVIHGKNAQGKTNLLEALWLFTGAKSFRGAKDSEMIGFGSDSASLHLTFFSGGREQQASIRIDQGKRSAELNSIPQKSTSALMGVFCAVLFSPEHLTLVKEGPVNRRNFLDAALCQQKPSYLSLYRQYQRALQQRNALLKDIPRHSELIDTMDVWDHRLASLGAEIILQRDKYVRLLEPVAKEIYSGISQDQENFGVNYQCGLPEIPDNAAQIAEIFSQKLRESRRDDIYAGFTSVGPHRDDLALNIDGVSARAFASQGQQRSIVLSLKLAESELLASSFGESPIIFLDDVMSELDDARQDYLLNHLEEKQVFLTCCDPDSIKRLNGGTLFHMEHGVLTR